MDTYIFRRSSDTSYPVLSMQITSRRAARAMMSPQMRRLILNSRFPIPVASYQCTSALTISPLLQSNVSDTLSLAPPAAAIAFAQPGDLANAGSCCNRLGFRYVPKNLKVHEPSFQTTRHRSNTPLGASLTRYLRFRPRLRQRPEPAFDCARSLSVVPAESRVRLPQCA